MPHGPLVPIKGIWLRREGNYAVVYVEKEDGKSYEAIREHCEGYFSHHITEWGLAGLTKLDSLEAA